MQTADRIVRVLAAPYHAVELPLSASVGMAFFPEHGEHLAELIRRADQALYQAKHSGKSRVEVAGVPT